MLLHNLQNRFLQVSLLTIVMGWGVSEPANALDFSLSWNGDGILGGGISSLTGTFSGVDSDSDGILEGGNLFGSNELTAFDITFNNSNEGTLATYNLSELLSFSPDFNFNYNIASGQVLQSGNANSATGFSIGNGVTGYLLDTSAGSGISFADNIDFSSSDLGGTLNATTTAVPFEFSQTLSLVILGGAFAMRKSLQRRKIKAVSKS
ncbi:MAG: hypothetical protein F6K62_00950 [Sphaerospermopsis sp. SIO1G2]|nr:hypothetical protein [Sphaerospermopsis sp. SIO1G2]